MEELVKYEKEGKSLSNEGISHENLPYYPRFRHYIDRR